MATLVWFRSDLRVADNPALHAAVSESPGKVVGLFVATPGQWERHDWGPPKMDFVLRSVAALAVSLSELGIELRVEECFGFEDVPEVVLRVARETGSEAVKVNSELEVNERRRDRSVRRRLAENSVGWKAHWDQTIVPPGRVLTGSGRTYTVFTPFFRSWVRYLESSHLDRPLPAPPPTGVVSVSASRRLESKHSTTFDLEPVRELWPEGEAEAERRLSEFLETSSHRYHIDRDDPNLDATSSLSPYLAAGAISPRRALWAALEANQGWLTDGDPGLAAWIRQLAWRDFYRHVLLGFPRVSKGRAFRGETDGIRWRRDSEGLRAWQEGRTGFPIVDAAMRSLHATGFMHNRLRMIVASFLSKDLLVDWREGERFFMRHLVDADLANNNGGWQWAASTGVDSVPYFRVFNPWRQSQRFDPKAHFIRRFVPELSHVSARALHDPLRLAKEIGQADYPLPIVDHGKARARAIGAFRPL